MDSVMARHIRSGDSVVVIAGRDKGKTGKVLRILTAKNRCVVEGVNRVWKHVRPSQRNPQGGRIQKDAPIHLSNVMPLVPGGGNRGTRVRTEVREHHRSHATDRSAAEIEDAQTVARTGHATPPAVTQSTTGAILPIASLRVQIHTERMLLSPSRQR